MWIQDLREVCEKSFDSREIGQLEVESLRVEWHKAFDEKEVDEALLEGLERRATSVSYTHLTLPTKA